VFFPETKTDDLDKIELEGYEFKMEKIHLDKNRHGDDFIDFINDDLVALDKLEIPRQRNSMDTVKNCYGNKLLELCRGNSLFLLNGRVGEDQHEGRLTCKNSSTVDYCLCTVYLLKYINNLKILHFSSIYSGSVVRPVVSTNTVKSNHIISLLLNMD
jgi:hypothetical protein